MRRILVGERVLTTPSSYTFHLTTSLLRYLQHDGDRSLPSILLDWGLLLT